MRLANIRLVLSVVLLFAGILAASTGVHRLPVLPAVLTAEGPEPTPNPWHPCPSKMSILVAEGPEPTPTPWRGLLA